MHGSAWTSLLRAPPLTVCQGGHRRREGSPLETVSADFDYFA